jgi:hypothetical protein
MSCDPRSLSYYYLVSYVRETLESNDLGERDCEERMREKDSINRFIGAQKKYERENKLAESHMFLASSLQVRRKYESDKLIFFFPSMPLCKNYLIMCDHHFFKDVFVFLNIINTSLFFISFSFLLYQTIHQIYNISRISLFSHSLLLTSLFKTKLWGI